MKNMIPDLVTTFLAGRKEQTRRAYSQDLEEFQAFVAADTIEAAVERLLAHGQDKGNALALAYRNALVDRGLATATVKRRLAGLSSLAKLGRVLGVVPWTLAVQTAKIQPYRDTRGPGHDGFRAMLAKSNSRTGPKARHDRAILRLLYELGLRRGEVVSLDLEHVDVHAGTVAVLGKARAQRELFTVPGPTLAAVREWIAVRGGEPGPLFTNLDPGHPRQRLTGAGLYDMIRKLGTAASLRVWPHGLRHAAITEVLNRTKGDLYAAQDFSRLRDLNGVSVYNDNRIDRRGEIARLLAEEDPVPNGDQP